MLLQEFVKSVRSQNWFFASLEFLLLVLGIFLGFQLDSWNKSRLRSSDAVEYRVQLLENLKQDIRAAEVRIGYFLQVREHGLNALGFWEQESPDKPVPLVVSFFQASQIYPFSEVSDTFEELKSTGNMELLGSIGVRSAVFAYYRRTDITQVVWRLAAPYREEVRGIIPIDMQFQIREECSYSRLEKEVITPTCELDTSEEEARQVLEQIRGHASLRRLLTLKLTNEHASVDLYRNQIVRAQHLMGLLGSIDGRQP